MVAEGRLRPRAATCRACPCYQGRRHRLASRRGTALGHTHRRSQSRHRRLLHVHRRADQRTRRPSGWQPPVPDNRVPGEPPVRAFLLDVGFRRDEQVAADTLTTEALLTFAEIPPVEVQAIPLELQVAEKLHAYTRIYESGRPSTRAKDLVDLTLIAELSSLDAEALHVAIETTFTRRNTHPRPTALPQPPREWATQYRRLAEEVGAPLDLAAGYTEASALLTPILDGAIMSGTWSPGYKHWAHGNSKS